MANTENIEAKLCAYVDGELDQAGRVEIEKHLADHPQHRKLLAELMRTRELLRELPHEKAPAEVAETLQGQLERSVLLANLEEDEASATLRINRWPQFGAIAAVVLLAVGLGVVLYTMLPSPGQGGQLSILQDRPPAPVEEDDTLSAFGIEEDSSTGSAAAPPAHAKVGPTTSMMDSLDSAGERPMAKAAAPEPEPTPPPSATVATVDPATGDSEMADAGTRTDPFGQQFLAKGGSNLGRPSPEPLVMVVTTDNIAAASKDVEKYFAERAIAWHETNEPMPQPLELAQSQVGIASRYSPHQVQMKDSSLYIRDRQMMSNVQREEAIEQSMEQNAQRRIAVADRDAAEDQPDNAELRENVGTREQATESATADQIESLTPQHLGTVQQSQDAAASKSQDSPQETRIVARALTPQQVSELNRMLTQNRERQLAQVYAYGEPVDLDQEAPMQPARQQGAPATVLDQSLIQPGDQLRITVQELDRAAGLTPINEVVVGEGGTINPPMLEPVRAAGLTEQSLRDVLVRKYEDANLISGAHITVKRFDKQTPDEAQQLAISPEQPAREPAASGHPPRQAAKLEEQRHEQAPSDTSAKAQASAEQVATQSSDAPRVDLFIVMYEAEAPATTTPADPLQAPDELTGAEDDSPSGNPPIAQEPAPQQSDSAPPSQMDSTDDSPSASPIE